MGRFVLCAFVALAACSSDTGLLIEVTRADGDQLGDLGALRFWVAEMGDVLTDEPGSEEALADVAGRDLVRAPYRLLLEPGDIAGDIESPKFLVAVVAFRGGDPVAAAIARDIGFVSGQVHKYQVVLTGDRIEVTDTGCLRIEGILEIGSSIDRDCDGDPVPDDCNDDNPAVGPSQPEVCSNDDDDDCDGENNEVEDDDGDGYLSCDPEGPADCNDNPLAGGAAVHPGAEEICDGLDNNCDDSCDSEFDADGDGVTKCGSLIADGGGCSDFIGEADCVDEEGLGFSAKIYPGAPEVCDGLDNNCDLMCDVHEYDTDGDSFAACGTNSLTSYPIEGYYICTSGTPECAAGDGSRHPAAREICNGIDDDCRPGTMPAPRLCFDSEGAECFLGTLSCPTDEIGICEMGDALPAPATLCAAADACGAITPDPGAENPGKFDAGYCALLEASLPEITLNCKLAYVADPFEGPEACASMVASLPESTPDNCYYALAGGVQQPGYTVSLAGDSTPTTTSCADPTLTIANWTGFIPKPATFYILNKDGDTFRRIRVTVSPERVDACPVNPLTCIAQ